MPMLPLQHVVRHRIYFMKKLQYHQEAVNTLYIAIDVEMNVDLKTNKYYKAKLSR